MLKLKVADRAQQFGFTLIELMIALILATLVIAASMGFLFSSVKSSTENINMILLNQELRSTLSFIHDELRRSGFTTDPEDSGMIDLLDWDDADDCLTFGYQRAVSTAAATMSFKLDEDGSVLFKDSDDASAACSGIAINDTQRVRITAFDVSPANLSTSSAHPTLGGTTILRLTVTLTGEVDHPPMSRSLSETIRVRNESPQ